MRIRVRYFARLRERLGRDAEELTGVGAPLTVGGLRALLAERNPGAAGALGSDALLVAVNREYAAAERSLEDGDEVALFPPVSGG